MADAVFPTAPRRPLCVGDRDPGHARGLRCMPEQGAISAGRPEDQGVHRAVVRSRAGEPREFMRLEPVRYRRSRCSARLGEVS